MIKTDDNQRAFDTAVKYLAVSPRSFFEVKEKLYKKGFHKSEVEYALAKAQEYNYINDSNYIKSFVLYYGSKMGKKKMLFKLTTEKGINRELALNTLEDLVTYDDEISKAVKIATKYAKPKKIKDENGDVVDEVIDYGRIKSYLYQKGFEFDVIEKAVELFRQSVIDKSI